MMRLMSATQEPPEHLFVAWRDAADSSIHPVGRLSNLSDKNAFEFRYLNNVKNLERFVALPGFPQLDRVYRSHELFPLFEVRIMSRRRTDYPDYISSLGLLSNVDHDPFVLLARSEGWKSTDRLEVFAAPRRMPDSEIGRALFFLRGLRYHEGAADIVDGLALGATLVAQHEPTNPVNPLAIQILSGTAVLGHVPDYLVDHVHEVWDACGVDSVELFAEHVNPDSSGSHMRLLCRMESCWPAGYEPFSDARFLPLVTD
jgi:hypothetical protein